MRKNNNGRKTDNRIRRNERGEKGLMQQEREREAKGARERERDREGGRERNRERGRERNREGDGDVRMERVGYVMKGTGRES